MTRPSRPSDLARHAAGRTTGSAALGVPAAPRAGRLLLELSMASRLDALEAAVASVVAACREAGAGERACRFTIPLVVTEVLANAIERGNGGNVARRVHLTVRGDDCRLMLEVRDEGDGFDLAACRGEPCGDTALEQEGGRGLFIVCALTESVETMVTPAGGLVRVTFKPS